MSFKEIVSLHVQISYLESLVCALQAEIRWLTQLVCSVELPHYQPPFHKDPSGERPYGQLWDLFICHDAFDMTLHSSYSVLLKLIGVLR